MNENFFGITLNKNLKPILLHCSAEMLGLILKYILREKLFALDILSFIKLSVASRSRNFFKTKNKQIKPTVEAHNFNCNKYYWVSETT